MERIERGGENDGPHDRIEERAENHCQLPDEQEKDAEESDGKQLSAIHEWIGLLKKAQEDIVLSRRWCPQATRTIASLKSVFRRHHRLRKPIDLNPLPVRNP